MTARNGRSCEPRFGMTSHRLVRVAELLLQIFDWVYAVMLLGGDGPVDLRAVLGTRFHTLAWSRAELRPWQPR